MREVMNRKNSINNGNGGQVAAPAISLNQAIMENQNDRIDQLNFDIKSPIQ